LNFIYVYFLVVFGLYCNIITISVQSYNFFLIYARFFDVFCKKYAIIVQKIWKYGKKVVSLQQISRIIMAGKRIAMAAAFEWYKGELDEDLYLRTLVKDKHKVMAVCKKPRYTKQQKKKMAERPQIKRSNDVIKEAQVIYHDPVLRAEWEQRHEDFIREAKKKGEYTFPRLWDYIRHVLTLERKASGK